VWIGPTDILKLGERVFRRNIAAMMPTRGRNNAFGREKSKRLGVMMYDMSMIGEEAR
jgi:hypothetical protein